MTEDKLDEILNSVPQYFALFTLPAEPEEYEGAGTQYVYHNRSFISLKNHSNYGFLAKDFRKLKFVGYVKGKYSSTGTKQHIQVDANTI